MKFSTVISIAFLLSTQNYCGINLVLGNEVEVKLINIVNRLFNSLYHFNANGHNQYCKAGETAELCLKNNIKIFSEEVIDKAKSTDEFETYEARINNAISNVGALLKVTQHEIITLLENFRNYIENRQTPSN